ncbi:MAG: hypothetical protein IJ761_01295 [Bacteroidales bacterium]|nr:hypothetical protein [Bacteroidales bacterium]
MAFAAKDDIETIVNSAIYKGCVVYYATSDVLVSTCSGHTHYVLVSSVKNGVECRYTMPDETLEIMDLQE